MQQLDPHDDWPEMPDDSGAEWPPADEGDPIATAKTMPRQRSPMEQYHAGLVSVLAALELLWQQSPCCPAGCGHCDVLLEVIQRLETLEAAARRECDKRNGERP